MTITINQNLKGKVWEGGEKKRFYIDLKDAGVKAEVTGNNNFFKLSTSKAYIDMITGKVHTEGLDALSGNYAPMVKEYINKNIEIGE